MVEVVNGGLGLSVRGDSSIDLTFSFSPDNELESLVASLSPRRSIWLALFSLSAPLLSKSFVVAKRLPETLSNLALNPWSVVAVRSHQVDAINAIRSRSRSTINLVATD